MSDLHSRIKSYLASKKPTPAEKVEVEIEVKVEEISAAPGYIFIAIILFILFYQAFKYGELENQCYMNKECKEWVKR